MLKVNTSQHSDIFVRQVKNLCFAAAVDRVKEMLMPVWCM